MPETFSSNIEAAINFDWSGLATWPVEYVQLAVKQSLCVLEGSEETIFHARMRVLRVARQLELYKLDIDPEWGQPFTEMGPWIQRLWPKSWRYCKDAMKTEEPLKDVPMETLSQISGANLKVLADEGLSSGLRTAPDVIEAAKTLTKDKLIDWFNEEKGQNIQKPALMPKLDVDEFEAAIEMARVCDGCESRAESIKAIAISYIQDHAVEYERRTA